MAMKTLLIVGLLLTGLSGQALSMGHPHNVFAARKQMRAKASASVSKQKVKPANSICWHSAAEKADMSARLLRFLGRALVARAH